MVSMSTTACENGQLVRSRPFHKETGRPFWEFFGLLNVPAWLCTGCNHGDVGMDVFPQVALHRMQPWGEHACHELEMSILTSESRMLAAHCAQPWMLSPNLEMAPFTFRKVLP